jgi:hypothetical protein
MNSFIFEPVQFLDIKSEDNPKIDVKDGMLLIHANRNGDRIVISAPLNSVLPSVAPVQTKVKNSSSITSQTKVRRVPPVKPGSRLPVTHGAVGQNNPLSKLTETDVREIRFMSKDPEYTKGFSSKQQMLYDLAKIYGIHWTTVNGIIKYKSWKHIKD